MKVYKLTNQNHETFGGCKWGKGVRHKTNGWGGLCGPGWLHYYASPEIAVFMNPLHADIPDPVMWEAEARGEFLDDRGLKGGCTDLTTLRIIETPEITVNQRVRTAIYCAREMGPAGDGWNAWAGRWLSGEDRTRSAADFATATAYDAAFNAGHAVDYHAAATLAAFAASRVARVVKGFDLRAVILRAIKDENAERSE